MNLQWKFKSEWGTFYLVASPKYLVGLHWQKQSAPMAAELGRGLGAVGILHETVRQLREYFAGRRQEFDLPLEANGTEFQKEVWKQLRRIPFGKTISYQELALRVGRGRAARAVGSANGRNPLGIVVPCHRVIRQSGELGGYAGGLALKSKLLALEKKFSAADAE